MNDEDQESGSFPLSAIQGFTDDRADAPGKQVRVQEYRWRHQVGPDESNDWIIEFPVPHDTIDLFVYFDFWVHAGGKEPYASADLWYEVNGSKAAQLYYKNTDGQQHWFEKEHFGAQVRGFYSYNGTTIRFVLREKNKRATTKNFVYYVWRYYNA